MTEVMQSSCEDCEGFVMIVDVASALYATYGLLCARISVGRVSVQSHGKIA